MSRIKTISAIFREFIEGQIPKVRLYRLYLIIVFIAMPLFFFLIPKSETDPFWLRLCVAIPAFVIFILTYTSKNVRDNIVLWVGGLMFLLSGWLSVMLYLNSFDNLFSSIFFSCYFFLFLTFESKFQVLIFSLITVTQLIIAGSLTENPEFHLPLFYALSVLISLVAGLVWVTFFRARSLLEEGLSRSQLIQEAAIESSKDGILLVDPEGNFLKVNVEFCSIWGIPMELIENNQKEEALRLALKRVNEANDFIEFMARANVPGKQGEVKTITLNNNRIIETYWTPLIRVKEVIGRLWFFRDITEQMKYEQRLVESQKRLRMHNERLMHFAASHTLAAGNLDEAFEEITRVAADMLEVDSASIWTISEDGQWSICEKLFRSQTLSFEAGAKVRVSDHLAYFNAIENSRVLTVNNTLENPETAAFHQGAYTGSAKSLIHAQVRVSNKMRAVISLEMTEKYRQWTLDEQSIAVSMADLVAVAILTSEKEKVRQEIENSSALLQAIFDLSETGINVEDNKQNILNYNHLFLDVWHLEPGFEMLMSYSEIVDFCAEQLVDDTVFRDSFKSVEGNPGIEYESILIFKDGRSIERYSKAIFVGGKIVGRVWFYLDITERKNRENELIERNFELDSFVYRASHDLKAPLNSIMGLIDIVRGENEQEGIEQYLMLMNKSVKKLDEFIRELTQFSQDARLKVVSQPIMFDALIKDTLADLQFMELAGRLKTELEIEQDKPFLSDPIRLSIIFNNLISNAIKYQNLERDDPKLIITVHIEDNIARISFRDNGVGIQNDHLKKIFNLFFRASVQASGSGLGLYITQNALKKIGGNIDVRSEKGKYTEFILEIPSR